MEENNVIFANFQGSRNFQKEKDLGEIRSVIKDHLVTNGVKGDDIEMTTNDYVTHKELKHFEEKENLKFDNINTKIDGSFKFTNEKIDEKLGHLQEIMNEKFHHTDTKIDNSINEFKIEIENNRKATTRWIIGTSIALAGVVIAGITVLINILS